MKFAPRAAIALSIAAFSIAALATATAYEVSWKGALRDTHAGDTRAKVRLAELPRASDLYGVGPMAGLAGEITIVGGKLLVAQVEHGKIRTSTDYDQDASFLVWATVPQWRNAVPTRAAISSHAELEAIVEAMAREAGVDTEKPFPFLLEGTFKSLKYHVVRPAQAGTAHGGPADSALSLEAAAASGTVVGFFSRNHEGVFTHRGSHAHLHVSIDGGDSGHIDELAAGPGLRLILPR